MRGAERNGKGGKRCMVQGLARSCRRGMENNLALSQPKARPSPNSQQPGQARHKLRRWNYNHVTTWRFTIRKASATACPYGFYVAHEYLAAASTPAVSHRKQEKICLPSLHCRHVPGPMSIPTAVVCGKIGRASHAFRLSRTLFFVGSSVNKSPKKSE